MKRNSSNLRCAFCISLGELFRFLSLFFFNFIFLQYVIWFPELYLVHTICPPHIVRSNCFRNIQNTSTFPFHKYSTMLHIVMYFQITTAHYWSCSQTKPIMVMFIHMYVCIVFIAVTGITRQIISRYKILMVVWCIMHCEHNADLKYE